MTRGNMREILKRRLRQQLEEQLGQQPGSEQPTVASAFEVRCHDCDVSFPVGTRRCMYCGGRPGHKPLFVPEMLGGPQGDFVPLDDPGTLPRELEPVGEEEPEQGRGSILRVFGNLSWILLFAALTLYRACTG